MVWPVHACGLWISAGVLREDVHVVAALPALARLGSGGVWRSGWSMWGGRGGFGVGRSMGVGVNVFHSFAMRLVFSSITVICKIRKR